MCATPQRKKLPVNPSLEHLQKQAKQRAKQNSGLQLAAAQHQLAKEYGCQTWAELVRMVESMLHRGEPGSETRYEAMPKAARAGDIEHVRKILETGEFTQHNLDQSLAHALWYGDESTWMKRRELADLLVSHGADPDGQYGSGGYGPIVFGTAECIQPDGLQYLIDAGADITGGPIETKYGLQCIATHLLGTYDRGNNVRKHRYLEILIEHSGYIPPEITPAILAIHRGARAALGVLLEQDPGLVRARFASLPYGNTLLNGGTLLHYATEFGEVECMEELLRRGADKNAAADVINGLGGQTPIYHAISCGVDGDVGSLQTLLKLQLNLPEQKYQEVLKTTVLSARPIDFSICAKVKRFDKIIGPTVPFRFSREIESDVGVKKRLSAAATYKCLREQSPLSAYTPRAQQALSQILPEAKKLGHITLDGAHIFMGLLAVCGETISDFLKKAQIASEDLRKAIQQQSPPETTEPQLGLPWPHRANYFKVFEAAIREAKAAGKPKVETGHLFIALLMQKDHLLSPLLTNAAMNEIGVRAALEIMKSENDFLDKN